MDVKFTFLNGVLKEEVYVEQSPSYELASEEHKLYRLKRDLYGFKQAQSTWYSRIDSYLISNGYSKSDGEPTLYIKATNGIVFIVVLYVDDLIFTRNDNFLIGEFKEAMKNEFEITDIGLSMCRIMVNQTMLLSSNKKLENQGYVYMQFSTCY